ncbi:hypothetical protein HDU86_006760 [Geranomyces michiganensis]|nr:hypothetical protein HDU86_006760 [Geranomyces michiganensis]
MSNQSATAASSSTTKPKVLLTGATGYIGGTVLDALIKTGNYDITALVRDDERAAAVTRALPSIKCAVAGYTDYSAMEAAAAAADIVVHTAESADQMDAAKALIRGLKRSSGSSPRVYLHTSGTGVLSDQAMGGPANPHVHSDVDMTDIDALADSQPHRSVDKVILEAAGNNNNLRTAIICPPLIYGLGSGAFNTHSQQVPALIKAALKQGRAVHAGAGDNLWPNVHVRDLGRAFVTVLERVLANDPHAPVNRHGYYFVENGEHNFRALVSDIALALEKRGVGDGKPHSLGGKKEIEEVFGAGYPDGSHMLAGNSRCRAVLLRRLGWKPVEKSLGETVPHEVAHWVGQHKTK